MGRQRDQQDCREVIGTTTVIAGISACIGGMIGGLPGAGWGAMAGVVGGGLLATSCRRPAEQAPPALTVNRYRPRPVRATARVVTNPGFVESRQFNSEVQQVVELSCLG